MPKKEPLKAAPLAESLEQLSEYVSLATEAILHSNIDPDDAENAEALDTLQRAAMLVARDTTQLSLSLRSAIETAKMRAEIRRRKGD